MLLLLIILILLFGGGGGWYGWNMYGAAGLGVCVPWLILVIILIFYMIGAFRS
jgi:hypothetical protein